MNLDKDYYDTVPSEARELILKNSIRFAFYPRFIGIIERDFPGSVSDNGKFSTYIETVERIKKRWADFEESRHSIRNVLER